TSAPGGTVASPATASASSSASLTQCGSSCCTVSRSSGPTITTGAASAGSAAASPAGAGSGGVGSVAGLHARTASTGTDASTREITVGITVDMVAMRYHTAPGDASGAAGSGAGAWDHAGRLCYRAVVMQLSAIRV